MLYQRFYFAMFNSHVQKHQSFFKMEKKIPSILKFTFFRTQAFERSVKKGSDMVLGILYQVDKFYVELSSNFPGFYLENGKSVYTVLLSLPSST